MTIKKTILCLKEITEQIEHDLQQTHQDLNSSQETHHCLGILV